MNQHYKKNKPLPGMTEAEHVPYRKKGPRPGMADSKPEKPYPEPHKPRDFFTWRLDETNCLHIHGRGPMPDWNSPNQVPWHSSREQIRYVIINPGVTDVGSYAFQDCANLTGIILADSISRIGADAFAYCSSLKEIALPRNVTAIGGGAFSYCSSLISVSMPKTVDSIGPNVFYRSKKLRHVTMPQEFNKLVWGNEYIGGNFVTTFFKDYFGIPRWKVTFI